MGNRYDLDADGEPVLLSSRGQQVMMQWERQYMEACVDALCATPADAVLEIGFGLAFSASRIQRFRPRRHTIVECDAVVLARARVFSERREFGGSVEIAEGTWQAVLPTLGQFDCVFFDDYPLPELESAAPAVGIGIRRSRWHDFLDVVLYHVRPGARITGYLARAIDLEREGCTVQMTRMAVSASASCNYYPHQEAFVPVITVLDSELARTSTRHLQRERLGRVREQLAVQDVLLSVDPFGRIGAEETEDDGDGSCQSERIRISDQSRAQDELNESTGLVQKDLYAGHSSRAAYLTSLRARRLIKTRVISG